MDKQSTIGFILIGIILILWLYWNTPTPPPPQQQQTDTTLVQKEIINEKEKKINEAHDESSTKTDTTFSGVIKPERIITIETDLAKIELTTRGAKIRKYYLKKYETWYHKEFDKSDFYNRHVQLVNTQQGGDFNIIFVTKDGKLVNTSNFDFDFNADNYYYKLSDKDSLVLTYNFTTSDNRTIKKNFTFYGNNYAADVDIEFDNFDDIISSYRYDVVWNNGINFTEKNSVDEANHSNASVYAGDEQTIIDATHEDEKYTKDINGKVDWVSVRNKYFTVILSPENPSDDGGAYIEGYHKQSLLGVREYYSMSLKVPFKNQKY
ncbi:MAG: membrane protein insertase YidC, partial [Melioribacter sp.]|nr:membrane protein insertase YidC [Melioribacter sp.]